jgi:hypothetical protein
VIFATCCLQEQSTADSAFSSRALTSVISSGDNGSSGVGGAVVGSGPQRMLETWIICELANAGNLQDAVMHHNGGAFFYQSMPHMVSCFWHDEECISQRHLLQGGGSCDELPAGCMRRRCCGTLQAQTDIAIFLRLLLLLLLCCTAGHDTDNGARGGQGNAVAA